MDIRHFYVEKGQGDPLILLHGNGESHAYFQKQTDVFADRFHVYAIDTRGHGQTPRGEAPFTIRQFAEDLLAFMEERRIPKAILMKNAKKRTQQASIRSLKKCKSSMMSFLLQKNKKNIQKEVIK